MVVMYLVKEEWIIKNDGEWIEKETISLLYSEKKKF